MRPVQTFYQRDLDMVISAQNNGFRGSLGYLAESGRLNKTKLSFAPWADFFEDEEMGQILAHVRPPTIRNWDLLKIARIMTPGTLSQVLTSYAAEIREQPVAALYCERERRFIKLNIDANPADWEEGPAYLAASKAVDPLAGASRHDIATALHAAIEQSKVVSYTFDPHSFIHLVESDRIGNLAYLVSARLENLMSISMHPAVLTRLIAAFYARDKSLELFLSVCDLTLEGFQLWSKSDQQSAAGLWRVPAFSNQYKPTTNEQEKFQRAYFNLGILLKLQRSLFEDRNVVPQLPVIQRMIDANRSLGFTFHPWRDGVV
jgi:hypothetical protein